jgi:hypothetical protein
MVELDQLALFADELHTPAVGPADELATSAMIGVIRHSAAREPEDDERRAVDVIAAAAVRYETELG